MMFVDWKLNFVEGFNFDYEIIIMYNLMFEVNDGFIILDLVILCLEIINVNEVLKF